MQDLLGNIDSLRPMIVKHGTSLGMAIIYLVIGHMVISSLTKIFDKALEKKQLDVTIRPFLEKLFNTLLKVALYISVLGQLGVETTSFVAVIGAAGLAVGMALQGSLSNFAGSVLLLIFKPFKVGDVVEAQGFTGTIANIGVFCTTMKTPDNKTILIPNGPLANGAMTNYTTEKTRRVDWVFGIAYGDDLKKAQSLLLKILNNHQLVLKDPAPFARVGELADSSVNFKVRAWTKTEDYWSVYFDVVEEVKLRFDDQDLNFPFPQREVHMVKPE